MSSSLGPSEIHQAEQAIPLQATLVWAVGAFCISGWDLILCLPQEYLVIWKKKLTPITVLYLVNRYFGLLQFAIVISLIARAWSPVACKHIFYWHPVVTLISGVISQTILGVRVYAIYAQNRVIAMVLASILVAEVCIAGYSFSTFSPPILGPSGVNPTCIPVVVSRGWMIAMWVSNTINPIICICCVEHCVTSTVGASVLCCFCFLVRETGIFCDLSGLGIVIPRLTAWKTYNLWRKELNTPLLTVIWRDGVLYFFGSFSMTLANVLVFWIAPPSIIWIINVTPTLIFTVIMSCRLVLNTRSTLAMTAVPANSSGLTGRNSLKTSMQNQVMPNDNLVLKSQVEGIIV